MVKRKVTPKAIKSGVKGEIKKMVGISPVDSLQNLFDHTNLQQQHEAVTKKRGKEKAHNKPKIVRKTLLLFIAKAGTIFFIAIVLQVLVYFVMTSFVSPEPTQQIGIPGSSITNDDLGGSNITYLILAIQVAQIIVILYFFVGWFNARYILTEEDIIVERGIFHKQRNMYATSNVESIKLNQNLLQRLGNFGTICLYAPTLNQSIYLHNVPKPMQIQKRIDALIHPELGPSQTDTIRVLSDGSVLPKK